MSLFPLRQWTQRLQTPTADGTSNNNNSRERDFLISTDPALVSIPALMDAFGQEYFYWSKPLPAEDMQRMVDTSMCFGLYVEEEQEEKQEQGGGRIIAEKKKSQPTLIGFARLITDTVSFAFLTDVYVIPEYQGTGLGTWMLNCVDEVLAGWPHLRRLLFLTTSERARGYYERTLGAEVIGQNGSHFVMAKRGAGNIV